MRETLVRKLFLVLLLFACEPEKIYIDRPIIIEHEEEPKADVWVNVIRTSTVYTDGIPLVTANGRVKNNGPGRISSVRILLTSNHGYTRAVFPTPSTLLEGETGLWSVSRLQGTYIKYKDTFFSP